MCNCVYVCVVNSLCLKDFIHCSLIRDGLGTRGVKILQSLCCVCVCVFVFVSVLVCVCVVPSATFQLSC